MSVTQNCSGVNIDLMNFALNKRKKKFQMGIIFSIGATCYKMDGDDTRFKNIKRSILHWKILF